jgi:hypothetical protein
MFTANDRTHHRDRLALTWVVAELVEDLRNDDRFTRARVEREPKQSTVRIERPSKLPLTMIRSLFGLNRATFTASPVHMTAI